MISINKYMLLWQPEATPASFTDCHVLEPKCDRFVLCVKVIQGGGDPLFLGVAILSVQQDTAVNPQMTAGLGLQEVWFLLLLHHLFFN